MELGRGFSMSPGFGKKKKKPGYGQGPLTETADDIVDFGEFTD